MYFDPLEALAARYDNVIVRDRAGNPSIFVRFEKCLSSDLDPSLPAHVHPAFIIDGKERDYILIGKYKAGELESGNTLYSLPGIEPKTNITINTMLGRMRGSIPGVTSGLTIADYGFLVLLAQKNGWDLYGNNYYGQDYRDGTAWNLNDSVAAGAVRVFRGWRYTAISAHTTSLETMPDSSPAYWKRGEYVGGAGLSFESTTNQRGTTHTANGSGPASWYLGGDVRSLSDIGGSAYEFCYGYRTVDMELQILPNNDAADPEADLSATSGAWRAILPHAEDDGYDLVAPGTEGTLKWNLSGTKFSLDTVANTTGGWRGNWFVGGYTANSATVPHVPHILKELGLYPSDAASGNMGRVSMSYANGENLMRVWNTYSDGNYAGIARKYDCYRSTSNISIGGRLRALA